MSNEQLDLDFSEDWDLPEGQTQACGACELEGIRAAAADWLQDAYRQFGKDSHSCGADDV